MRVGDKTFASELLKTLRADQAKTTAVNTPRTGIGTVESYVSADNTYGLYLYGASSGLGASDGFHSMSGLIPSVGDTVSYSIDGQNRHITGILTGATPPLASWNPTEGWMSFTNGAVPPQNPPTGEFYYYYKDGIPFYMDDTGAEFSAAGFVWQGAWVTATDYNANDTVSNDGSTYMCTTGHTSSASDEPGVGGSWTTYWDYMAQVGDPGPQGDPGADGADGAVWLSGAGVPDGGLGEIGDWYLNETNGDVYEKTGASTWTLQSNLEGDQGAPGADGSDGSIWYEGSGVPSGGLGVDGDYYLNDLNGDVYLKTTGSWSVVANIAGSDGAQGDPGDDGATWHHGSGAPAGGLGAIGDFYLDDDTGQVYEKTGASTWTETTKFPDPPLSAPSTPTGLALSPVTYDDQVGLEASWASSATNVQQYTLQYDRAYTGKVTFAASAYGTGGSLAAGDYTVAVDGGAWTGASASVPTDWQTVAVAAGQRLYVNVTALPVTVEGYNVYCGLEGTDAEPLYELWVETYETGGDVEITARGTGPATNPQSSLVTFDNPVTSYTDEKAFLIEDLIGGTYYGAKVNVTDKWNQASAYTTPILQITGSDSTTPEIPVGLSLSEGYRMVGARWESNAESDLAYYEVRFAPEDATPGDPDDEEWTYLRSTSNWIIVNDLYAGVPGEPNTQTLYYFQIASVDTSGNQSDWSNQTGDYQSQKPSLITTGDIAYNSIIAGHVSAGGIEAEKITSGTLKVGGSANSPDYLLVYDGTGQEIGRWDDTGLTIADPGEPNKVISIVDGIMRFSNDTGATWGTAISAEGIIADSILSGSLPGGHNPVPNSSLELAVFSTNINKTWTSAGDWQGHLAGDNVNWDDASDPADITDYTY